MPLFTEVKLTSNLANIYFQILVLESLEINLKVQSFRIEVLTCGAVYHVVQD